MAEYPRKRKPPQSQFTDIDVAANYFADLDRQNNIKRAMNVIHNLNLFQPGYAESPEAAWNANAIAKKGVSSTGSSTRYKMMRDADKERVAAEFTSRFQEEDFLDMESFYRWTKTMGSDYRETLLRQHEAITKNKIDAMKNTKVAEAVDTLFSKYNDAWAVGGYNEQTQILIDIADSEVIKNLPSRLRKFAIEEATDSLTKFRPSMGRYAAATEARSVQQEADRVIDLADARADETLKETSEVLSAKVVQEAINLMGEDSNLTRDEALDKAIAMVVPRGKTQILDEQELKRRFDLFIPEETKLQTETYYDPDSQQLVSATDAEARELGLLPKEEAEVLRPRPLDYRNAQDRFWLESGQNLVDSGEITQVLFDFYKKNGRLIYSPREQDKWIIDLWRKEKKRLEDEASAKQRSIVFDMVTGASGGQKADGIGAVRLKKKESDQ
jgi:hypothetical protein